MNKEVVRVSTFNAFVHPGCENAVEFKFSCRLVKKLVYLKY